MKKSLVSYDIIFLHIRLGNEMMFCWGEGQKIVSDPGYLTTCCATRLYRMSCKFVVC